MVPRVKNKEVISKSRHVIKKMDNEIGDATFSSSSFPRHEPQRRSVKVRRSKTKKKKKKDRRTKLDLAQSLRKSIGSRRQTRDVEGAIEKQGSVILRRNKVSPLKQRLNDNLRLHGFQPGLRRRKSPSASERFRSNLKIYGFASKAQQSIAYDDVIQGQQWNARDPVLVRHWDSKDETIDARVRAAIALCRRFDAAIDVHAYARLRPDSPMRIVLDFAFARARRRLKDAHDAKSDECIGDVAAPGLTGAKRSEDDQSARAEANALAAALEKERRQKAELEFQLREERMRFAEESFRQREAMALREELQRQRETLRTEEMERNAAYERRAREESQELVQLQRALEDARAEKSAREEEMEASLSRARAEEEERAAAASRASEEEARNRAEMLECIIRRQNETEIAMMRRWESIESKVRDGQDGLRKMLACAVADATSSLASDNSKRSREIADLKRGIADARSDIRRHASDRGRSIPSVAPAWASLSLSIAENDSFTSDDAVTVESHLEISEDRAIDETDDEYESADESDVLDAALLGSSARTRSGLSTNIEPGEIPEGLFQILSGTPAS
eukprot:g3309.t1